MINKSRLIKLLQKTISYDSQNPPGNEKPLADFITGDMKSLKLKVELINYAKTYRPNVIATLKGSLPNGRAAKEAVLITPHFDTVPIGSGWKFDPLGGTIKGGKLYGRGASDDKCNLAVCMEVMRSMVEDGYKPRKDIIMAATVDEETGSKAGILPLLDKKVLKPALGVIMDSDDFTTMVAQKGLMHLTIRIFGKKAHGAYNWLGVNAIEIASRVIVNLKAMKIPYTKHPLLRPPTVNIGTIKGGDKVNMVSDYCEFTVDLRFPPGTKDKDVMNLVKAAIRKETAKFEIIVDDLQQPYTIDPKHPFVKAYLDTAKKMKTPVTLEGSQGATVISFFPKHKIPAFATGYGSRGTAHTTDEYCEIEKIYKGAKLLEAYLKEYDQI